MEPAEVEVTLEDQQNINSFGRLNNRLHELDDRIRQNKEEAESLEDASNEMILVDDEQVRCLWGEVFLHLPKDSLEEELEGRKQRLEGEARRLASDKEEVLARMAALKAVLYAKFKDSINLEED